MSDIKTYKVSQAAMLAVLPPESTRTYNSS